ncbi:MAG TPA: hypothetical protein VII73_12420 [Caulobacteraceae bacterium]
MTPLKFERLGVLLLSLAVASPAFAGGWETRGQAQDYASPEGVAWSQSYRTDLDRFPCGCAPDAEIAVPLSFFADTGGVGGFPESFDSSGGGSAIETAGAQSFATASASARVQIRFHGVVHDRGGHGGGCGCR